MAVYVDDARLAFGRMAMCHMIADTAEELLAMVDRIGVARKWIQHQGTYREHFDVCMSKRAAAVACGAVEITQRELGRLLIARSDRERRKVTVIVDGVRGHAYANSDQDLHHVCGSHGFGLGDGDVCPRCELNREAERSARNLTERGLQCN